jgi:hypothetical protein
MLLVRHRERSEAILNLAVYEIASGEKPSQ